MTTTTPAQPPPPHEPAHPPAKPAAPVMPDTPAEPLALQTRHRAPFAQARDTIIAQYGISPDSDELLLLWLALAPPWQIVRAFEESVLSITGSDLAGTDDGQFTLCL